MLPLLGGYLTDMSKLHLPRIELFLQELARKEPLYFQQRSIDDEEPEYSLPRLFAHHIDVSDGIEAKRERQRYSAVVGNYITSSRYRDGYNETFTGYAAHYYKVSDVCL
jgi:5'-3' exonuclease